MTPSNVPTPHLTTLPHPHPLKVCLPRVRDPVQDQQPLPPLRRPHPRHCARLLGRLARMSACCRHGARTRHGARRGCAARHHSVPVARGWPSGTTLKVLGNPKNSISCLLVTILDKPSPLAEARRTWFGVNSCKPGGSAPGQLCLAWPLQPSLRAPPLRAGPSNFISKHFVCRVKGAPPLPIRLAAFPPRISRLTPDPYCGMGGGVHRDVTPLCAPSPLSARLPFAARACALCRLAQRLAQTPVASPKAFYPGSLSGLKAQAQAATPPRLAQPW
jgi:hypothetical protein